MDDNLSDSNLVKQTKRVIDKIQQLNTKLKQLKNEEIHQEDKSIIEIGIEAIEKEIELLSRSLKDNYYWTKNQDYLSKNTQEPKDT